MTTPETTHFNRPMGVAEIIRAYEQQAEDHRRLLCALKCGIGLTLTIAAISISVFIYAVSTPW